MASGSRTRPKPEGIVVRHRRFCGSADGGPCSCRPGYQAQAYSTREERTIRRTFPSLSEARAWRQETQVAVRAGKARAPSRTTLAEASEEWLALARRGIVLTRSPPRHMKSILVSVMFLAWVWTSAPERRFLHASYAQPLAIRDSLKTRRVLESPWYRERWGRVFSLTGDQNEKARFENERTGYRIATSPRRLCHRRGRRLRRHRRPAQDRGGLLGRRP